MDILLLFIHPIEFLISLGSINFVILITEIVYFNVVSYGNTCHHFWQQIIVIVYITQHII